MATTPDGERKFEEISAPEWIEWQEAHSTTVVRGEFQMDFPTDLLHCETCGEPATHVHFTSKDGVYPNNPDHGDTVGRFACDEHDLGGYPVDFKRLFDPMPNENFLTHIAQKEWGLYALAMLNARLRELAHASMVDEGAIK